MSERGEAWLYRLFGLTLASDRPLSHFLSSGRELAALAVHWQERPGALPAAGGEPLFASAGGGLSLYAAEGGDLLRFAEVGEFWLGADVIEARVAAGAMAAAEIRLLGPVLAFWLERRGLLALHASAIAAAAGAVGFLGAHGEGKSSAAAAFLERGLPLLTDDILPLEVARELCLARPGYAQLRARPDLARVVLPGAERAPLYPGSEKCRVALGSAFYGEPLPLARLYLLARRDEGGGVEIRNLPRHEAVVEVVRHSFSPRMVAAAGLQPERLSRIAELVRRVPVRRLLYPTGYDALSRLADAVLADP